MHISGSPRSGWKLKGRPDKERGVLGGGDRFLPIQVREDFLEEGHWSWAWRAGDGLDLQKEWGKILVCV